MSVLAPILRPILQLIQQTVAGVGGRSLYVLPLTADNYITAGEINSVTISGSSLQIDDAETLTIAATDGTNNYAGTATVSGDAWTSSPVADFTGWDDGNITVTVTLDSDNDITRQRVAILDAVNDPPVISGDLTPPAILEGCLVDSLVVQLSVTDPNWYDSITWSIESGNTGGTFEIDQSGNITVAIIPDYETTASYSLVVRATDNGNPARHDEETITIGITDITVTVSGATAPSIAEDVGTGITIATYTHTSPYAVTWSIETGNSGGEFSIDSSGNLKTTAVGFDYETKDSFPLTIRATDTTLNEYDDHAVTVGITNVNEAPVVDTGQTAYDVNQDVEVGYEVHTFTKTDPDVGDSGSWSIESGNTNSDFEINSSTGVLTTVNTLDFATTPSYDLGIRFTDTGGLEDDITCVITILEEVSRNFLTFDGAAAQGVWTLAGIPNTLKVTGKFSHTTATDALRILSITSTAHDSPLIMIETASSGAEIKLFVRNIAHGTSTITTTGLSINEGALHTFELIITWGASVTWKIDGVAQTAISNSNVPIKTNVTTLGIAALVRATASSYYPGVVADVELRDNSDQSAVVGWEISNGQTDEEEASIGSGTLTYINVAAEDWEEFTLNELTSPDQWENGDQSRIIPIVGQG